MQDVDEPEARAAFIWILGEHGRGIQVTRSKCCLAECSFIQTAALPYSLLNPIVHFDPPEMYGQMLLLQNSRRPAY